MELHLNPSISDWRAQILALNPSEAHLVVLEPGLYLDNLSLKGKNNVKVVCSDINSYAVIDCRPTQRQQAIYIPGDATFCKNISLEGIHGIGGTDNVFNIGFADGISLKRCKAEDPQGTSNSDAFKISNTKGISVEDCQAYRPRGAGSCYDFVRCKDGIIRNCYGIGLSPNGSNHGIQVKVESENFLVENCVMEYIGAGYQMGDKNITVRNSKSLKCWWGFCFYDAGDVHFEDSEIIDPSLGAFSLFPTASRVGILGSEHYKNISAKRILVKWGQGFLTKGAWWIGQVDVHHFETYVFDSITWLNTYKPAYSTPKTTSPGPTLTNNIFGDGTPQLGTWPESTPPTPPPTPNPSGTPTNSTGRWVVTIPEVKIIIEKLE